MSADRGIESLLEEYKKSFLELKDSKASFLKTKFPRAELWRFFIEIPRQNEGLGWLENVMRILDTNERKELPALLDKPVEFHLKNVEELPRENQSLKGLLAGIATSAMDNLLVSDDEKRKEKFEKFSLGDMLTFYAGWLPFEETEPGCVKAFIDELLELEEKSKDSKLEEGREAFVKRNTALIKTFHKNVSKNVKNLLPEVKGEFRSKETARFSVNIGINFSEQGANEVLLSMARLSEKFPEFKADYDTSDDNDYYVSAITPSEKQSVSEIINEIVQYLLMTYYDQIQKATSSMQKLAAIVTLVRSLELVHPFRDANCRTLCLLYVNHLLLENGFPLTLLKDPNQFDGHTVEELIAETIKGMGTMLAVANGKKDLGGITTEEIVKGLSGADLELAYELGFAIKPSLTLDEKDYRAAVLHLKKYIEFNDWKITDNSIEITLTAEDSREVVKQIPARVYSQWELINQFLQTSSEHSSWKNIYEKAISIPTDQDEIKSNIKLFDRENRNLETDAYFKKLLTLDPKEVSQQFPVQSVVNKNSNTT